MTLYHRPIADRSLHISMNAFTVTVRNAAGCITYPAIAHTACDCIDAAIDHFGIAAVTATPYVVPYV